uniref:Deoxyhypusine synthase n=1 Tax=Fervidicoccus fontis TaxID=683846 RepID=A0A7J3ZK98_9CREN
MRRDSILRETIEDDPPARELLKALRDLVEYYRRIHGFMAGHLAAAYDILKEARSKSDIRILSFTGNIIASGIRGLVAWLIKEGHFNLVITTCGAVDHDIAKSVGGLYYRGSFALDDDALESLEVHRLGNVLIPQENYGPLVEKVVRRVFEEGGISGRNLPGYKLLWHVGSMLDDERSFLRAAWQRGVPVIVPGFYDGSFGTNVLVYSRLHNTTIDLSEDQKLLENTFFTASGKKIAALILGGGISKHHAIWWSQFAGGLDYAVYVTTAVEYDGSLSGAHPKEAISWRKLKRKAKYVVVYGDVTLVLPILASALV